jgi:hypothetical protein
MTTLKCESVHRSIALSQRSPSSNTKIFFFSFLALFLSIGCDDETGGLRPLGPQTGGERNDPISGTMAGMTPIITGGQNSAGSSDIDMRVEETCNSCEPDLCPDIDCLCPDGRSATFDGCVDECCIVSEMMDPQQCATLCQQLPPGECTIGATRCLEDNLTAYQRCNLNLEWTLESCGADEACQLGQCLPNSCLEGQTRCISPTELAVCNDSQWVSGGQCDGACAQGVCQSFACAQATAEKSYLGCEYVTLELPNLTTYSQPIPTAVVLTNPSEVESAQIQILGPNGQSSPLVAEQTISVPEIADLPPIYADQTVRSEVRDASDQVVQNMVMRADQISIPPGGTGTFLLPAARWPETGSLVKLIAHRVISDIPIGAYQFSPYCCNFSFSNDASLLLPTSTLGKNYRFIGVPTLKGNPLLQGDFAYPGNAVIVATRDQTEVRFTLPQADSIQAETQGRISVERGAYVVTLNQQETLLLRANSRNAIGFDVPPQPDLTGAYIESSEPIAVFSGHECSFYPSDLRACDHLEEQLFPTETWGTEFFLVPPKERGDNAVSERIYWKILAQGENAQLRLSVPFSELQGAGPGAPGVPDCSQMLDTDGQTINLGTRGFCEFSTKEAVALTSDQGITVMGIISGQESVDSGSGFGSHLGDPSIFLVPPARQARRDYAFLTPATYYNDFATITFAEGTEISLDGRVLDLSNALPIMGANQKYIHIELDDGSHKLQGSAPFSIMVMAYDDFVSYAFTGGLNLSKR